MAELQQFKLAISSTNKPVFVDFGAKWCPPCKAFAPTFKMFSEMYQKDAMFIMVDIEQGADIAAEYNVYKIPTVIVIKDEKVIDRLEGPKDGSFRKLLSKNGIMVS